MSDTLGSSTSLPSGGSAGLSRNSSGLRRTQTTTRYMGTEWQPSELLPPTSVGGSGLERIGSNVARAELPPSIAFGAVVHFTNHSVSPSQLHAWKAGAAKTYTGTGFYMGNKMIITNSHVIHNQTSLRLKRHGQPGNFAGRLLCESELCDLALITVDDDSFWAELPVVTLQDEVPELDATVVVVGYPASSGSGAKSVTVTRGVVSNVQMLDLSLSRAKTRNMPQLAVQIDAAINPGNSGGPVFNAETCAVVGVAFAGGSAQGHGLIIPIPVVKNFIAMYEKTSATNFGLLPELGFEWDQLVKPAFRRSCFGGELPSHRNGVIVTQVSEHGCAAGKFEVGDVLTAVDGVAVSEDGDVLFRGQEYLGLEYLFTRKLRGDTVTATVLRNPSRDEAETSDGETPAVPEGVPGGAEGASPQMQELSIELVLAPDKQGTPTSLDRVWEYCIVGGLVFGSSQALDWTRYSLHPKQDEDSRTQSCTVYDVLHHPINVSYDQYRKERLDMVDGVEVQSMRHLVELIQNMGTEGDLKLDFMMPRIERDGKLVKDGSRTYIVFDKAELISCEAEILEKNVVPCWCTPEHLKLPDPTAEERQALEAGAGR